MPQKYRLIFGKMRNHLCPNPTPQATVQWGAVLVLSSAQALELCLLETLR